MNNAEIRKQLDKFIEEIMYGCDSIEKARDIDRRLDAFVEDNDITTEQFAYFVDSGAGEALMMMVHAPTTEEWLAMHKE